MDTMDDNYLDDSTPSDIFKPRYLFRRYDSSGSSSSNSSSFSSNSVGSFQLGGRWPNDRVAQRKRTISATISESKWFGEESLMSDKRRGHGDGMTKENTHDESVDAEDECILCSSVVNERQYYLWQSQYTKSSLCSRCSNDNEGMRYISFWGTPVYKMGSWRKRYRAGRSLDIDLSPLLEVLERIDQIDTSMYGRKMTSSAKKADENGNKDMNLKDTGLANVTENSENCDVMESETYSSRRRRRLENRKIMENKIVDCDQQYVNGLPEEKVSENVTPRRHQTLKNKKIGNSSDIDHEKYLDCLSAKNDILKKTHYKSDDGNDSSEDQTISGDDNKNKTEFLVFETCQKFEHVDVIEPIQFLQASGQTIADSSNGLADLSNDRLFQENSKATTEINTIHLQRPEDLSSTENMIKYLKERRKSNYETFLAGLEPITNLRRCSTAEKDLVLSLKAKKTKSENICSSYNEKCLSYSNKKPSNDSTNNVEMCNKNIAYTKEEKEIEQSQRLKITTKSLSDSGEEYKHCTVSTKEVDETEGSRDNKNCKHDEDPALGQVKLYIGSKDLDEMLPTQQVLGLDEGNLARKYTQKQYSHRDSSSQGDKCEKATFLEIKRRFEKICSGETEKSENSLTNNHPNKILNGHFRSQPVQMTVKRKNSDIFANNYCNNGRNEDNSVDTKEIYKKIVPKDDGAEIDECDSIDYNDKTVCQNVEDIVRNIDDPQLTTELVKRAHDLKPLRENSSENVHGNSIIGENKCNNSLEIPYQDQKQKSGRNNTNTSIIVENKTNSDASKANHSRDTKPNNEQLFLSVDKEQRIPKDGRSSLGNNREIGEIFKNGEFKSESSWDQVKQNNAKAREKKYKQIIEEEEVEDSNPDIQRIKLKLRRRPKYDDSDSDTSEKDGTVMELDGSNDEEAELCWRTRGYDRDFFMSRKSVTGSEILDRYKRAVSNRRFKKRSRKVTESETDEKENEGIRGIHRVSAPELMAVLDRAASCSERMTQRLKSQLRQSYSSNSSS